MFGEMRRRSVRRAAAALAAALAVPAAAVAQEGVDPGADPENWRPVPAERLIVMDTTKGRVLVELYPEFAPLHAARIESLVREGFYDDIKFHRVIDGFVIQGGDPFSKDLNPPGPVGTGGSGENIPAEFTAKLSDDMVFTALARRGPRETGFVRSAGVITGVEEACFKAQKGEIDPGILNCDPEVDYRPEAYISHCPGAASMARAQARDSADSQFFLVRGTPTQLDAQYTGWGRVVAGIDVVYAINIGTMGQDPGFRPDSMTRVRMADQLSEAERPEVYVQRAEGAAFAAYRAAREAALGRAPELCEIYAPGLVRVGEGPFEAVAAPPG